MTPETLIEPVLDEAEAIVCAEWMRLQFECAGTRTAIVERSWPVPRQPRMKCSSRRRACQRVWPTQRSPPAPWDSAEH